MERTNATLRTEEALVPKPICSLRSPGGAGKCGMLYLSETQGSLFLATLG